IQAELAPGQGEDGGSHRMTLGVVAVEQLVRRPARHGRAQLPAEVQRVLQPGVHSLGARGRVGVRRVAGQEDPARAVAGDLAALAAVLWRAKSVPEPMAIPTVASARAGASLIPSPIIATRLPDCINARTRANLYSAHSSALKSVTSN